MRFPFLASFPVEQDDAETLKSKAPALPLGRRLIVWIQAESPGTLDVGARGFALIGGDLALTAPSDANHRTVASPGASCRLGQ